MDYLDLIGKPYGLNAQSKGAYDCASVAEEIHRRLRTGFTPTQPARDLGDIPSGIGAYFAPDGSKTARLGDSVMDATREGDLVVVGLRGRVGAAGLYCLVSPRSGLFITATPASGVHTVPRERLQQPPQVILGVYRVEAPE